MRSGVRRRWSDAATALAAGTVAAVCAWAASSGTVGALERAVFSFVNGWPDVLRWPLWIFQTLGVLGMPLIVAAAALLFRRWRLAVALVLLVPLKLLVEKDVLKALVQRERPGTTIPGAILRDVPSAGVSFPSGHAVIVFGIFVLVAPYLRRRWQVLVLVLAILNSVARVYLGGHAPLDIVGGAAAGVLVGSLLDFALGVPARPATRAGENPSASPVDADGLGFSGPEPLAAPPAERSAEHQDAARLEEPGCAEPSVGERDGRSWRRWPPG
jgi:membrane-associated phospholipid phosphatase